MRGGELNKLDEVLQAKDHRSLKEDQENLIRGRINVSEKRLECLSSFRSFCRDP